MKTLVINKRYLNIGGIESIVYNLINYALSQHYRVIWLAFQPITIFRGFADILDKIETISAKRSLLQSKTHLSVKFNKDEEVTILSFTPFEHDFALRIKEKNPSIKITPLYIVANTKGHEYYIELFFSGHLRQYVKKRMGIILGEWNKKDYIRYFTQLQREAYEGKYGFVVSNPTSKKVPTTSICNDLDENALVERSKRETFNIISVSRFSFPHKRYLLGLVDAFAQMKPKYHQLRLYIIGYGEGEDNLRKKIEELPGEIRHDIHLLGPKTSKEIDEIMTNMHLNVSVAGSVKCGARNGVVSLPARNFCKEVCEVYGYLPESFSKLTATEEGMPVNTFIDELINMPKDEYIQKCKDSYFTYSSREANPGYLFEQAINEGVKIQSHHTFFGLFYTLKTIVLLYRKFKRICFKARN